MTGQVGSSRPSKRSEHLPAVLGLVLAASIFAGLSIYQLDLPGLHYDEAFEAVPALQLLLGQPVTTFRSAGLPLGQQRLPLMTQDYIGALNTYMVVPFIAAFGATPAAVRLPSILTGLVTLGLTYALAFRLTNSRWTGLVATMLLAVDPTFIFWNRQGIFVTAVTATIGLAAAYCWLRRGQTGLTRWSVAGAFLFGLGLYAKLLFLWLIVGLVGAVILLNLDWIVGRRSKLFQLIRHWPRTEIIAVLLAFLLGCWPLIIYNIQTGGTLQSISQNASTSYYGVDNLALGQNLLERLVQFSAVLSGRHLWYLGNTFGFTWDLMAFVVLLIVIVTMTIRNFVSPGGNALSSPSRDNLSATTIHSPHKAALFPYLVIGLVIMASIGTVSALWITHFAVLMPWPALAIAAGSWYIMLNIDTRASQARNLARLTVWLALSLLFVINLTTSVRYHSALSRSGGLSSHSDAVYDLSDWLAREAPANVVAMDWGLAAPVTYLTGNQVTATELFGYAWDQDVDLADRLRGSIEQPGTLYLWRAPDEIIFDRSSQFKALYGPLNL